MDIQLLRGAGLKRRYWDIKSKEYTKELHRAIRIAKEENCKVSDIAEAAGISRQRVYQVLEEK